MGVRLEDVTPGALVGGIAGDGAVTVVAVRWIGSNALQLTFRTGDGRLDERLLYRDHEPRLTLAEAAAAYDFTGDAATFKLAAEALRIRMAARFDPMLAVHTSDLEPLPHQIEAVYGELLERTPLRFLLADDPGAGKTIMAGLYAKELMLRGDAERCLIVAPASLVDQWQEELADKFGLRFELLTRQLADAAIDGSVFTRFPLLIARMDQLRPGPDASLPGDHPAPCRARRRRTGGPGRDHRAQGRWLPRGQAADHHRERPHAEVRVLRVRGPLR
jgi:SNF2 domain-containing protein